MLRDIRAILIPCAIFAVLAVSGCVAYDDEYESPGVVVDRGYYFDPDYYDGYGHYHPRSYWYYDGHGYVHRDGLPHGETAHLRANMIHGGEIGHGSAHGSFHADHAPSGGDHVGGGDSGGDSGGDIGHGGPAGGGFAGGGHGR